MKNLIKLLITITITYQVFPLVEINIKKHVNKESTVNKIINTYSNDNTISQNQLKNTFQKRELQDIHEINLTNY